MNFYYSTAEWSDDDNDFDYDFMNTDKLYSHAEVIHQCDFRQVHLIDTHVYSNTTLLQPRENTLSTSDSVQVEVSLMMVTILYSKSIKHSRQC